MAFKKIKKSQIAIFVIIAILLVVMFIIGSSFKSGGGNSFEKVFTLSKSDLASVEMYVEDSLEKTIYSGLFVSDINGLETYIYSNFEKNLNFSEVFPLLNISGTDEINVTFNLAKDNLSLNVEFFYPLTISEIGKEGFTKISNFQLNLPLKNVLNLHLNNKGEALNDMRIKSVGGALSLNIFKGNVLFNKSYEPLESLSIRINESSPENTIILHMEPDGAVFLSPLLLIINYSQMEFLDDVDEKYLVLLGLNQSFDDGDLIYPTYVNTTEKIIMAPIWHFSSYSITTNKKKKCIDDNYNWCKSGSGVGIHVNPTLYDHGGFECWTQGCEREGGGTQTSSNSDLGSFGQGMGTAQIGAQMSGISQTHSIADFESMRDAHMSLDSLSREEASSRAMRDLQEQSIDDALEGVFGRLDSMSSSDIGDLGGFGAMGPNDAGATHSDNRDAPGASGEGGGGDSSGSGSGGGAGSGGSSGEGSGTGGADCFTGSQLVLTPLGYIRIDELSEGDIVISYDEITDEFTVSRIGDVLIHDGLDEKKHDFEEDNLLLIKVKDDFGRQYEIEVTSMHLFYLKSKNVYERVKNLKVGDILYSYYGDVELISKEVLVDFKHEEVVYNLHMDIGPKNYLVNGVVVHNKK